jgi:hypothetical protein
MLTEEASMTQFFARIRKSGHNPRAHRYGVRVALCALIAGLFVMGTADDAKACGGCFHQQTESTVVTDHRMAFSISPTQTILWDQIRYQGSPKEFAWVLPVQPGARVELSSDRFIAALDALTQPQIIEPIRAGSSSSGAGCSLGCSSSATSADFASRGSSTEPPVQVVSESVVGPYQTVILRSQNPLALENWLTTNGYVLQASVKPIITQYVTEGLDFLALRLRPGVSVRAMEPVRVITPGADVSLPLRMVAAGVGASVGLTLFVIGEGRYRSANFPNVEIETKDLFWNFTTNRSNYQELSLLTMGKEGGRSWLTEASLPNSGPALQSLYVNGPSGPGTPSPLPPLDFDAGDPDPVFDAGPEFLDAEADAADLDGSLPDSGEPIADAGRGDAQAPSPDPDAGPSMTRATDDYEVAIRGMRGGIWVTRLRANLPVSALLQDLKLEASPAQVGKSTQYLARDPNPPSASVSPIAPAHIGSSMLVLLTMGWLAVRLRRRETSGTSGTR